MKSKMLKVTVPAIMASLAILLEFVSANTGWTKFTIHGIPLMFTGIMFGPTTGLFTGIIAGGLVQLQYPFTIASPVYALSYVAWAVVPGLLSLFFKNKQSIFLIVLAVVFASIVANLFNTGAMFFDAMFVDGSWMTKSSVLARWAGRLVTMFFMLIPNIFLLGKSILALHPLISTEVVNLEDLNFIEIPVIESL